MKLRHIGESTLVCICCCLLPFLPRPIILAMARSLGKVAWRFSGKLKTVSMANLDIAFGDTITYEEKERIIRGSLQTFSLLLMDLFWFGRFSAKRIEKYVEFDSSFDSYFKTAPAVAVSGHFGNWEALGLAVAQHGEPMMSVATPLENAFADKVLNSIRSKTGQEIASREGAVKAMMRTLRKDGRVGILMDQNVLPSEGGEFVDFCNLKAPMSKAAATLSVRTGADVVFIYCMADSDGMYKAYSLSPVSSEGLTESALTQRIAQQLEEVVKKYPDKWLWMYKRWKYVADGEDIKRYPYYARSFKE